MKCAQELYLKRDRHLAELVQEERAAVGTLERATMRGDGSRECPAFMTQKLALGQVLGDGGRCESRQAPRTAAKPPAQREPGSARQAPKPDSAPAQVLCGQTGCLPVKRGCSGELRKTGNSEVAVVTCP